jgi:hypothetical protein
VTIKTKCLGIKGLKHDCGKTEDFQRYSRNSKNTQEGYSKRSVIQVFCNVKKFKDLRNQENEANHIRQIRVSLM